jgi:WD40-like Beta Propeller Repeat
MRPARATAIALLAACALSAAAPLTANADVFGATSLLSGSPFGQAEYAHDPVISEDGRYVLFDGSVAGVTGVWRRETRPGASFEQVAGGDAVLPSVSADGRYVSFTTNEGARLPTLTDGLIQTGTPQRESPGVYVRDMTRGPAEGGAFTLASAKDHSTASLTYEFPGASGEELATKVPVFGATATGRSAITADGRTVAFVTTAQSDLAGPATPPLQVAVRHLDSAETVLVSVRYDPATGRPAVDEAGKPKPVQLSEGRFGAVWSKGSPPGFETNGATIAEAYRVPQLAGASISADGSTVAWLGEQISEQARTLSGEELTKTYAEPLWRRISAGQQTPTRRVTGGSDPESPACLAHPESALPPSPSISDPCQGPFATQNSGGLGTWNDAQEADAVPRLSANGDRVAFVSSAPLVSEAGGFGIGGREYNDDAYWVDMTAPDRVSALHQLTQFASGEKDRVSTNAAIDDIAISSDGLQIAFTTRRIVFPLGTPAFVSVPAAVPGLAELYEVDLGNQTLTRVTQGYSGGAAEHPEAEKGTEERYAHVSDGALSPSFSQSGKTIAFSSTASNLVFGDGNTPPNSGGDFADGGDAFLAPRITFSSEPTPQIISPAPPNPSPEVPWTLAVSASSLANGTVRIKAVVPAAGTLAASASSSLPAGAARRNARRKVRRTVAHASTFAKHGAASVAILELSLSGHYLPLAGRAGGLPSTVTVSFAAAGHPTLRKTLTIRFLRRSVHHARRGRR